MLLPVHGAANAVSHKFKESKASSMGEMPPAKECGSDGVARRRFFEQDAKLAGEKKSRISR